MRRSRGSGPSDIFGEFMSAAAHISDSFALLPSGLTRFVG